MSKIIHYTENCNFLVVKPNFIVDYNHFILSFMNMGYRVTGVYQHYVSFEKGNRIVNLLIPIEYYFNGVR